MSVATINATTDMDAETLTKSAFDMLQANMDHANATYDDEAGRMDYRHNEITAVENDTRITITIQLGFVEYNGYVMPIPDDFEEKRCAKYVPNNIAFDVVAEKYTILHTFWSGKKLNIVIDNADGQYTTDEIIDHLSDNCSLDETVYQAAPGENFWVVSYAEIKAALQDYVP